MEKKFSKGNWNVSDDTSECYLVKSDDGGLIAFVYDGDIDEEAIHMDVVEANAKLIASAPELLEACQWALKQFEILNDKGLYPTHLLSVNGGDGLMTIIKAINKATK